tara:strand:+ start:22097 stop:22831 length:735 start_codon:yes stop_codon:yes gene_type:complete
MAVTESLLVANAALNVGKGVFNWLNAKNKRFKMTPEERKAQQSAARQSTLGMGGQEFQTAANQIRAGSADARGMVRNQAFASGLENSAVARVGQQKVQNMSENQIADLALQIADRNSQFRQQAAQRSEMMNMQLGERKRQFEENRRDRMTEAAFNTATAVLDLGVKSMSAKESTQQMTDLANQSKIVNAAMSSIVDDIKLGNNGQAMEKINALAELNLDLVDVNILTEYAKKMFEVKTNEQSTN